MTIYQDYKLKNLFFLTSFILLLWGNEEIIGQHHHQKPPCVIRGIIYDNEGNTLPNASAYIKETYKGVSSDTKGKFYLRVPEGTYTLCIQMLGFKPLEQTITIDNNEEKFLHLKLKPENVELDNVNVIGQSIVKQINKTAYNVVAIDAKQFHNNSTDVAQVLDKIAGVKIKEDGGVGSNTNVSINGFTGNHIKIFMDGVPMTGTGSTMQINKLPINMADHIEVYKGVVPIELGGDALGGAINIITRKTDMSYIDASYSYGSFNTHKSYLSLGKTTKKGFISQLDVFQNYSDNDYKVKTQLLDLETNKYSSEEKWFRRFHDQYHNEGFVARIGLKDKSWTNRLMFELSYNQEYKQIQNANLMKIAYGGRDSKSKSIIPAAYYKKKDLGIKNLDLSFTGKYSFVQTNNVDTVRGQYNWAGEFKYNGNLDSEYQRTLSEFNSTNGSYVTSLKYTLLDKHAFVLNNTTTNFSRETSDSEANSETSEESDFYKRKNFKSISGFSYEYRPSKKINISAFGKYYYINTIGPMDSDNSTSHTSYVEVEKDYSTSGFGFAATFHPWNKWQLKTSYEKTVRVPSQTELFGDEILETGNASLKPENSHNVNLNFGYETSGDDISFNASAGLLYRYTYNYIRRLIGEKYGEGYYLNHGKVRTSGAEVEVNFFYKNLSLNSNFTYQDIRNVEKYDTPSDKATNNISIRYKDRMPNMPYMFSNLDLTYNLKNFLHEGNHLLLTYGFQFKYKFYKSWPSEGGDITIPTQTPHNFQIGYSIKNGRYNITCEVKNFTNEMLLDNYSLQKPGRSFSVKLRYYIHR